jgi:hypothetical protein
LLSGAFADFSFFGLAALVFLVSVSGFSTCFGFSFTFSATFCSLSLAGFSACFLLFLAAFGLDSFFFGCSSAWVSAPMIFSKFHSSAAMG